MDLAFVDKLAKYNNGVIKFRVHQDVFDRMVDAKGIKTKDSKVTVKTFSKTITKKKSTKKILSGPRYRIGRTFQKVLCC